MSGYWNIIYWFVKFVITVVTPMFAERDWSMPAWWALSSSLVRGRLSNQQTNKQQTNNQPLCMLYSWTLPDLQMGQRWLSEPFPSQHTCLQLALYDQHMLQTWGGKVNIRIFNGYYFCIGDNKNLPVYTMYIKHCILGTFLSFVLMVTAANRIWTASCHQASNAKAMGWNRK